MGGILQEIDLGGRKCWTLFDPERRHSFITSDAAADECRHKLQQSYRARFHEEVQVISESCTVMANIEDHPVHFLAWVVGHIGRDEDGREIDVLFGLGEMKHWGIKPDAATGRLDFTHYSRVFVEF
jgi:hypothetical protein